MSSINSTDISITGIAQETTLQLVEAHVGQIEANQASLATEATLGTLNTKVTTCNTSDVSITASVLPTGAATEATLSTRASEATLASLYASVQVIEAKDFATETSLTGMSGLFTDGNDIGDVTINNGVSGAAVNIQDGGNSITVDGTVITTPSEFLTVVDLIDTPVLDLSSTNMPGSGGLPTTLVASLANAVKKLQILDTSGAFWGVYSGTAGAEVLKLVVGPGSDQTIEQEFAAGERISFGRLDSASALATGMVSINFIGFLTH
jgi:hypothetical protein